MGNIFNTILVHPLLNLLVYTYHYIPDIGVVIIILTVLIRLLLYPSFHRSLKHQRALQALQPKMQEIREKHKDDQQAQAAAMMELYRVHKVNPVSSCLPLLIQLPILLALFRVFTQSLNGQDLHGLYSFVPNPGVMDPMFLHWINLAHHGNYWLAGLAAVLTYLQTRMSQNKNAQPTDDTAKIMNSYIMYLLPAMIFYSGFRFPAGMALYWTVSTLFGVAQQWFILRKEAKESLEAKIVK